MERYNHLTDLQKIILNSIYEYLGFNEATSFEDYIEFMFRGVRTGIKFDNMVNHTLAHIVVKFRADNPNYNSYIKHILMSETDMLTHLTVGSNDEYDPKGLLRLYIRKNYNALSNSKR